MVQNSNVSLRLPGGYVAVQLKDRFFTGMNEKMRDSMKPFKRTKTVQYFNETRK